MDFHFNWPVELRRIAFKSLPQTSIKLRIAGFPNFVADMNAAEINIAVAEVKFGVSCVRCSLRRFPDFVHATTLLFFFRMPGIEYHAVARFQRPFKFYNYTVAQNLLDFAQEYAAFLSKT